MHSVYDWFTRHKFAVDLVFACVLWFMFIPFAIVPEPAGYTSFGAIGAFIFTTALMAPLAWRRTRPVWAGSAIAAIALLQWALGVYPLPADVAVPLVVYALAAFGPRWASLSGLFLALIGAVLLITRYYLGVADFTLADAPYAAILVIMVWVLVLFSWTAGDLTRTKRLREQALADRAVRLETEAKQERALAASDERAHIAREMHDIVAHSLSVIITQADGARYAAASNPEVAANTLATIAETGRSSLQEMRRLLGVLHGDQEAEMRPLPGLADLESLVAGIRGAGLPVSFEVTGGMRRELPPGAELTIYRCVQEALTNTMKHAGPNVLAKVVIDWQPRGIEVSIRDNGRGAASSSGSLPLYDIKKFDAVPTATLSTPALSRRGTTSLGDTGGGNGLQGMAERVKLYKGTLTAKPLVGGGFGTTAYIPYTEA